MWARLPALAQGSAAAWILLAGLMALPAACTCFQAPPEAGDPEVMLAFRGLKRLDGHPLAPDFWRGEMHLLGGYLPSRAVDGRALAAFLRRLSRRCEKLGVEAKILLLVPPGVPEGALPAGPWTLVTAPEDVAHQVWDALRRMPRLPAAHRDMGPREPPSRRVLMVSGHGDIRGALPISARGMNEVCEAASGHQA